MNKQQLTFLILNKNKELDRNIENKKKENFHKGGYHLIYPRN